MKKKRKKKMQTLVVINIEDDSVIIQTKDKNYTDTYNNFIYRDGGTEMPSGVKELDYNEYSDHCIINGEPSKTGTRYSKNLLKNIDIYITSKTKHDREEEKKRTDEIFAGYDREREEQEKIRIENLSQDERDEMLIQKYSDYVEEMFDAIAKEKRYDSMEKLCTYAVSSNPKFSAEGRKASDYRDMVWSRCYQILDMVKAGQIEVPTKEGFLALLPTFSWDD